MLRDLLGFLFWWGWGLLGCCFLFRDRSCGSSRSAFDLAYGRARLC